MSPGKPEAGTGEALVPEGPWWCDGGEGPWVQINL